MAQVEILFGVVPDWLMALSGYGYGYGSAYVYAYGGGFGSGYGICCGSGYGNGDICHGCLDGSGKAPDNDD